MTLSKSRIPHFSYFEEVDITELESLRGALNTSRDDSQPKLTYLPFIMLALSKIMPEHPECNALYDDEEGVINRHGAVNLGIATQTERGLYVPVVKNVETMDIWRAASEMQRVAGAARDGSASLDELSGSTSISPPTLVPSALKTWALISLLLPLYQTATKLPLVSVAT